MRRFVSGLAAAVSLASIPAFALADAPAMPHDCTKRCDCAQMRRATPQTNGPESQQHADWVKSIWTSP